MKTKNTVRGEQWVLLKKMEKVFIRMKDEKARKIIEDAWRKLGNL